MDIAAEFEKFRGNVGNTVTSIAADFEAFRNGGKQPSAAPLATPAVPTQVDYLERLKIAESGGQATAQAKTSSAGGHHQFVDKTWTELSNKYKLNYTLQDKFDPEKSRKVAELYTNENREILKKTLGTEPTDTQLYTAHFLGTNGAKKFLTAPPNAPAVKHVAANQVKANKSIFYDKSGNPRKVIEVYSMLQKKIKE